MIAGRLKWVGEVMKDGLAVMVNHGGLPVHQAFGMNDFASERHGQGLMPETDSQDRDSPGELTDCRHGYSGLFGRTGARRSLITIVRMLMQVSMLPEKLKYPTAPAYGPRRVGSSSSMICIARILGAPDTVPAGKQALITS